MRAGPYYSAIYDIPFRDHSALKIYVSATSFVGDQVHLLIVLQSRMQAK